MSFPLKNKKLCVFDFDGTLVRSMEAFADVAAGLIHDGYGLPYAEARARYLETSGLPFVEQLESMYPGDARNPQTVEAFEKNKLKDYFTAPFEEGAEETIAYLRYKGIKVAISSNNHQEVLERFLDNADVRFDAVLGYRDNFSKGPKHFQHLSRQLKIAGDLMIFIGDSLKDAEKAKDHGIDFVAKAGTFSKQTFQDTFPGVPVIKSLKDLKTLL